MKLDVFKYKGEAMSTQMEIDTYKKPELVDTIKKRKAERAAAQLQKDNERAAAQEVPKILQDNYNRMKEIKERGRAERGAVVQVTEDSTSKDLQGTTTQLEYMRACLCRI
jgi:hypothetical protein